MQVIARAADYAKPYLLRWGEANFCENKAPLKELGVSVLFADHPWQCSGVTSHSVRRGRYLSCLRDRVVTGIEVRTSLCKPSALSLSYTHAPEV